MIIRRPEVHLIDLARYFSIYSYNCGGDMMTHGKYSDSVNIMLITHTCNMIRFYSNVTVLRVFSSSNYKQEEI